MQAVDTPYSGLGFKPSLTAEGAGEASRCPFTASQAPGRSVLEPQARAVPQCPPGPCSPGDTRGTSRVRLCVSAALTGGLREGVGHEKAEVVCWVRALQRRI